MVIFHCYVSSPEGNPTLPSLGPSKQCDSSHPTCLHLGSEAGSAGSFALVCQNAAQDSDTHKDHLGTCNSHLDLKDTKRLKGERKNCMGRVPSTRPCRSWRHKAESCPLSLVLACFGKVWANIVLVLLVLGAGGWS